MIYCFYQGFSVLKIFAKMGIYYGEKSGKGFKAKLKVTEEELEKYLESWDVMKTFLEFLFSNVMPQKMNMSFGV